MTWDIQGFDSFYLRPVFAAKIIYAAGPASGTGQMNVLCVGLKIAAGNLVLDSEIRQVFSRDDIVTAAGDGSQLALMAIAALKANPNVSLYLIAPSEAGGGTAATVTMLLATVPAADGTISVRIAGATMSQSFAAGTPIDTIGANLAARINAQVDCPCTAGYNAGTDTLTITSKNVGVGTKDIIIYQDLSLASTLTSTITGSAVVNTFGQIKGVRMGVAGGAGTEDYTTILTKIGNKRYARVAFGSNDATNAPLIKTFIAAQAAVTVQIYDQYMFGHNGTQGQTTTLAQTVLNDPRAQVYGYRNSESMPWVIAGGWAATRAATEGDDPVPDYDNFDCSGWLVPTQFDSDTWLPSEENALLNAGVTPIKTQNATPMVVRSITTYCLNGAVQDTRTLDIGDAVFPDFAVLSLANTYAQFRAANKFAEPDVDIPGGDSFPVSGVATPDQWVKTVIGVMHDWRANGWIEDTFSGDDPQYPVQAAWNKAARRIQSNVPFVVSRIMHQLSVIARQTAPS